MRPFARRALRALAVIAVPLFAACALARPAAAQDAPADSLVEVRLSDGSVLYGVVVAERADTVTLRTAAGLTVDLPREGIVSLRPAPGRVADGEFWPADPNPTRLFFGPTARAVGQGQGYLGVFELFIPFVTYGVSDAVTVAAGTPLVPGLIGEVFYVAPKLTVYERPEFAAAVGVLYGTDGNDGGGLVYGAGTWGDPDGAVTAGAGWFVSNGDVSSQPVVLLGGERRLTRRTKLLTENYFVPGEEGVFASAGVRFFGERLSADLGLGAPLGVSDCTVGECFAPLVNFVYAF